MAHFIVFIAFRANWHTPWLTKQLPTKLIILVYLKGIDYNVIDLTEDAAAMEMVQDLGYRQAPVVIANEDHWAGFRPDMINRLA